jgi:mannose-1-phosphate guanylyltransferase
MTRITTSFHSYFSPEDNNRAAIVITNKEIDAVLISQLSDYDTVILEIEYKNTKVFIASAYFDITKK